MDMRSKISLALIVTFLSTATIPADAASKSARKKAAPAKVDSTMEVAKTPTLEPDSLFQMVKVGPAQTASWLAFRHLGAWTPEIAQAMKSDNPTIQNLDVLELGTILRLRISLDQRHYTPAQQISKAIRKGVVTLVKGSPDFNPGGTTEPQSLRANVFLAPGDQIVTHAGDMVEIIIDNQSVLRLRDKAILKILAIQDESTQGAQTAVSLELGRMWSKVRKWAGPLVGFQVKMPNAIAGVHGTTFECLVNSDSTGSVTVYEGIVGVSSRLQVAEALVGTGKSVFVRKTGEVSAPSATKKGAPDWNRFNQQRDQAMEDQSSARQDDLNTTRSPLTNPSAADRALGNTDLQPPQKPR